MGSQNVPGNMYAYRESRVSHFRFCTGGPVMLMPPPPSSEVWPESKYAAMGAFIFLRWARRLSLTCAYY